ncbi:TetR family transcriptional regulator [Gordonia pseudamarae]|jgi:AcrR family transcriptional regulator|uniref:TetR family transcriptional regulator n=1 Tax=Gordonia pseudamarae TaxID=2831662 RepID=A0ABX6IGY3_9ACTN|nr:MULTISPECIES: TetR/AcrR family transcriptional regulator [Gordonia]MBD0024100.1 TetR/AcrR family transcriptional regulator [Gordonia sp. (in: high G+C Gram-positive bacteria)]QHN25976.1 TetR family transcriptional regulator [Gordonia pseudamarae]QHN34907.1 TetR family transcriptional regulator [Gordonia pseudamarae]
MPDDTELLVPRKRPAQERSKRKFQAMLGAARELLIEVGIESLTCEEIATRAEVPIGTLYQYFANKYVIVCELDRQDTATVRDELAAFADEVPSLDWPHLLEKFLDHLAALWRTDPSRRAVWLAVQSTPSTRLTAIQNERLLAELVARALAPLTPSQRGRREMMSQVLVHTTYSLLSLSVQDVTQHQAIVAELKRMLAGYLLLEESVARVD